MNQDKEERNILVIGGSGGIGQNIVQLFDKNGWKVAILSRNADRSGGNCIYLKADLTLSSQIDQAFTQLKSKISALDAVIFAAGVIQDQLLINMVEADWDQVCEVNLKSVWALTQKCLPLLEASGGGHLVHLGSIAGLTGGMGQANYSASKAGLIALSKSFAQELGPKNIRSNVVLPGFLKTPMTQGVSQDKIEKIKNENSLGRMGTVEEVARFIYFLCSTDYISGQVFNLDSRILPTF